LAGWAQDRVRTAAQSLAELAYAVTGWRSERWQRNRAGADQQRQIAEAIHRGKGGGLRVWPLAQERQLLQLIRAGDLAGARRHLNQLLAEMFLDSPRQPVLQARALELLGYLVRVAVEDEPECAALMASHQAWIVRIIGTNDFESLCATVRDALDDFMGQVATQGLSLPARHVRRVLEHIESVLPRVPTLDEAARAAGVSRFRLAHLLKQSTGQTFGQHLARFRVDLASRILTTTSRDCADIAAELGFADQSHFTRVFRTVTGTTPARYRRQNADGG
jgi:AraC-like DNA-binding protein